MYLVYNKYHIEWKNSWLTTSECFPGRTFQIIWLQVLLFECSLVTAIFTTTADLAFGGTPGLLFQLSLLQGLRAAKSWSTTAELAHAWWLVFLFSPSLWYSHSVKKRLSGFLFCSQWFSCLSSFMKWTYTVFEQQEESSLGIWVLSSKPWCCLELAWYSQLGLVLSYWPQTI